MSPRKKAELIPLALRTHFTERIRHVASSDGFALLIEIFPYPAAVGPILSMSTEPTANGFSSREKLHLTVAILIVRASLFLMANT